MLSAFIALGLAQAAATATTPPAEPIKGPIAMTRAEIRAYNAALPRDHPSYIRCVRTLDTGSLVRKTTSCRTNAEWRRAEQIGNDDARRTVEITQTSGSTNGN